MPANPFVTIARSVRRRFGPAALEESADAQLLQRYVASQDEGAFAALVERHGPMVWGTCRRAAGDSHAAEDAFQATWLVLSRKARSIRDGGSLPGWLHRVALRLALAAPGTLVQEAPEDTPAAAPGPEAEAEAREARTVIDEEVDRLPEKYRLPVLLCFFQGRTHAEAAAELGWPIGTVAGRLARAKDRLRDRLTRRGLALAAFPIPLAGAYPAVAAQASVAAAALAAKLLAGGLRTRMLVGAPLLLLPLAAVLVWAAWPSEPTPRPEPARLLEPKGPADPPRKEPLIIQANRCGIWSVAFSPDGKLLATTGNEELIRLWDALTGKEIATLRGHTKVANTLAFNPDGNTLASGSDDRTIRLWDLATGKHTATFWREGTVCSVAFSPDGKTLASASDDQTIKLWDLQTGKVITTFRGHQGQVRTAVFSPDGKTLASVSGSDYTVRLWDVATGKEVAILAGHGIDACSVVFSPDGKVLAANRGKDLSIKVWDVAARKERFSFGGGGINPLAFSPDGKTLASGMGGTIQLWDVNTGKELVRVQAHEGEINSLAFSPDGKTLASGAREKDIKLWDVIVPR
jgi:RNA polymerase sigma factor (sigma-70 family)